MYFKIKILPPLLLIFGQGACTFSTKNDQKKEKKSQRANEEPEENTTVASKFDSKDDPQLNGNKGGKEIASTKTENGGTATLSIPKDSLPVEDDAQLEPGSTVSNDITGAYLSLPRGVEPAGPAILVKSEDNQFVWQTLVLQLPIYNANGNGLALLDLVLPKLVVFYKVHNKDGTFTLSYFKREQIDVVGKRIYVNITTPGLYQAGYLPEVINAEPKRVVVTSPILSLAQQEARPVASVSSISANASAKSFTAVLSNASLADVASCVVDVDRSKSDPIDYPAQISQTLTHTPVVTADGTYYARFACELKDGRVTGWSAWSTGLSIDVSLPTSTITTAAVIGPESTAGGSTNISGTAADSNAGVQKVVVAIYNGSKYLSSDLSAFSNDNETWIDASGTTSWSLALLDTMFSNGSTYLVKAKAIDLAGNAQNPVTTLSISWDNTEPSSTISTATTIGPQTTAGSDTIFSGTAADAGSGLLKVQVAITDGTNYLNTGRSAFDQGSPVWLDAVGTDSWTLTVADNRLTNGVTYTVKSRAVDQAGNIQGTATTRAITYDSSAPGVISIARQSPPAANTNATTVTFRVTFSEPVSPVTIGDFSLAGSATGAVSTLSAGSGTMIDVIVISVGGNGNLRLDLNDSNSTIVDAVGNAVSPIVFASGESYVVDNSLPTSMISTPSTVGELANGTVTVFTGTASDSGSGVQKVQVSLSNGANFYNTSNQQFDLPTETWIDASGSTSWTFTVPDPNLSHGVTYTLKSSAKDNANNIQGSPTSQAILYDAIGPAVSSIVRQTPSSEYVSGGSVIFRVTFGESVNAVIADFAMFLDGAGATIDSITPGPSTSYDVTVSVSGNGTARLKMNAGNSIVDAVGNPLANSGFVGQSYTVDNTAPTVAITTSGTLTPTSTAGPTTDIVGTSNPGSGAPIQFVDVSLMRNSDSMYWNGSSFVALSETWNNIPSASWTLTVNDNLFANGGYTIHAKSTDYAGNVSAIISGGFSWEDDTPPATGGGAVMALVDSTSSGLPYSFFIDKFEVSQSGGNGTAFESMSGVTPLRGKDYHQMFRACAMRGLRLPTNEEWQAAAKGDLSGSYAGCATDEIDVRNAGSNAACQSDYGVYDMSANLTEAVDWFAYMNPNGSLTTVDSGSVSILYALTPGFSGTAPNSFDNKNFNYSAGTYIPVPAFDMLLKLPMVGGSGDCGGFGCGSDKMYIDNINKDPISKRFNSRLWLQRGNSYATDDNSGIFSTTLRNGIFDDRGSALDGGFRCAATVGKPRLKVIKPNTNSFGAGPTEYAYDPNDKISDIHNTDLNQYFDIKFALQSAPPAEVYLYYKKAKHYGWDNKLIRTWSMDTDIVAPRITWPYQPDLKGCLNGDLVLDGWTALNNSNPKIVTDNSEQFYRWNMGSEAPAYQGHYYICFKVVKDTKTSYFISDALRIGPNQWYWCSSDDANWQTTDRGCKYVGPITAATGLEWTPNLGAMKSAGAAGAPWSISNAGAGGCNDSGANGGAMINGVDDWRLPTESQMGAVASQLKDYLWSDWVGDTAGLEGTPGEHERYKFWTSTSDTNTSYARGFVWDGASASIVPQSLLKTEVKGFFCVR